MTAFLYIKDYIYFRSAQRTLEKADILIGCSYQRLPRRQLLPKNHSFDFLVLSFNPGNQMNVGYQAQCYYLAEIVYPGKPLIILGDTDWEVVGDAFSWRPSMRQLPALTSPGILGGVAHSLVDSVNMEPRIKHQRHSEKKHVQNEKNTGWKVKAPMLSVKNNTLSVLYLILSQAYF